MSEDIHFPLVEVVVVGFGCVREGLMCVCVSSVRIQLGRGVKKSGLVRTRSRTGESDGGINGSDVNLTERSLTCKVTRSS